jgi:hypothetical protein
MTVTGATTIYPGQNNQPGGTLHVNFSNDYSTGDTLTLTIEPNGAANSSVNSAVYFATTPTVAVSGGGSGDTTPQFTTALGTNSSDSSGVTTAKLTDQLTIKFTNSAPSPNSDTWTFTVSGVQLDAGPGASAPGGQDPIDISGTYTSNGIPEPYNAGPTAPGGAPVVDAQLLDYTLTQAPLGVPTGVTGFALSDFALKELIPAQLQAGVYTLTPTVSSATAGAFTGTATVTATGMTVGAAPSSGTTCPTSGGSSSVNVTPSSGALKFCIDTASSSAAGSLTISGLSYNAPTTAEAVPIDLTDSANSDVYATPQPAVTAIDNPRIAGFTADDTAAAAADSLYSSPMNGGGGGAVILASDAGYQDALSASFLGHVALPYQTAAGLTAGKMSGPVPILLNPPTPPTSGEAATAAVGAIKKLGATTVYIVGGPDAVSDTVATQLEQISSTATSGVKLNVVRISGFTAEDTAAAVAQYQNIGTADQLKATPGAYGMYNNGYSESASGPASGTVATAILANGDEFQDALAASPLAYADTLPVLLNPTGSTLDPSTGSAITNLSIKQVIVVGGPAVVSDSVVNALEADGVSVLRVAGYTFDQTAAELASFELNDYTPSTSGATQEPDGLATQAKGDGGPTITVGTSRGDAYQDALASAQVLGNTAAGSFSPLLLNSGVSTLGTATDNLLKADGTPPAGGLVVYTNNTGTTATESILGDVVFGGTLAQTPSLVQSELNDIAAG